MIVAGGYVLVHRGDIPAIDGFLTVSDCLTCAFPSWWAVPEVEVDADERRSLLAHWGIEAPRLPDVVDATGSAMESGELGWPSVFVSPSAARSFARRTGVVHETLTLVGLGVAEADVDLVLHDHEPSESGYLEMVSRREPLAEGTDAGWEVLGYEDGGFHSWHCHPDLAAATGAESGTDGLLRTRDEACAVAQAYSDPGADVEAVPWLPWLLRTYSLKRRTV